ncbi:MAG: 6-phosphofructokinase [Clostridia bacterium]|nr:6-phosphofructokinase [Clostridia bacterium]
MSLKKNAVIGQSGGPTSAINATLAGVIEGCMEIEGIDAVLGMKNGVEGFLREDFINLNGIFSDKSNFEKLSLTPAAALGSCRLKIKEEAQFEKIFEVIEKHNIGYFFYIGGNDSMDAVAKLEKYRAEKKPDADVKFIGVPKTIDNDLCVTDHTPGFGSAAKYIACTVAEVARDCAVYTQKAVTIIEIMGRDAGWLTASAALAKELTGMGADLIYLPEVPFDSDEFIKDVNNLLSNGEKPYVIVAVSEGIKNKDGEYAAKAAMSGAVDTFGHAYLSGTGKYLENLVREKIGCKCRSIELNLMQRCSSHIASKTDIDESVTIGKAAAKAAEEGKSGRMMAFLRDENSPEYKISITDVDISKAANLVKSIPAEFISEDGKNVNEKCINYIKPLIKGECAVKYKDGLPLFFSF